VLEIPPDIGLHYGSNLTILCLVQHGIPTVEIGIARSHKKANEVIHLINAISISLKDKSSKRI